MRLSRVRKIIGLLLLLMISSCTKVVSDGQYGPLAIGQSKTRVLSLISVLGVTAEPQVAEQLRIANPTMQDLTALDNENGILVWFDDHPWPLRIIFYDDALERTWGILPCVASQEKMKAACEEVARFSESLQTGSKRYEVYEAIVGFETDLPILVGNFVVGLQQFRIGKNTSTSEYDDLLMSNNVWTFYGLEDLLWFDHFYSRVSLYFEGEKLVRIEHWRFPFELL